MLPMIAEAEAAGADWHLCYGGRGRASMAFLDELAAYGDRVTLAPQDETGCSTWPRCSATPRTTPSSTAAAPSALLAGRRAALRVAVAAQARCTSSGSRPSEVADPAGGERGVRGATSRPAADAPPCPPDRSILDVIEDAGIGVLGSCQEGTCGTCEHIVLDGDPDHRDSVLSASERAANDAMMVCVSRCRSDRLILDL